MNKLIVIAVALLASSTAGARDLPVEAGAFAGGHIFSSTSHLGWIGGASNYQLDNSGSFGIRFALQPLSRLSLESELGLTPTQILNSGDTVLMFGWRGHAVFHILTGRFRPFVLLGGGGITTSSADPTKVREDTRGELHAGLGVKFDIQCDWGVRVDGRVQFEQAHGSGVYFTEDWEIFAGVYALFGRRIIEKCNTPPIRIVPAKASTTP